MRSVGAESPSGDLIKLGERPGERPFSRQSQEISKEQRGRGGRVRDGIEKSPGGRKQRAGWNMLALMTLTRRPREPAFQSKGKVKANLIPKDGESHLEPGPSAPQTSDAVPLHKVGQKHVEIVTARSQRCHKGKPTVTSRNELGDEASGGKKKIGWPLRQQRKTETM